MPVVCNDIRQSTVSVMKMTPTLRRLSKQERYLTTSNYCRLMAVSQKYITKQFTGCGW